MAPTTTDEQRAVGGELGADSSERIAPSRSRRKPFSSKFKGPKQVMVRVYEDWEEELIGDAKSGKGGIEKIKSVSQFVAEIQAHFSSEKKGKA